jgi:hypothetical protein
MLSIDRGVRFHGRLYFHSRGKVNGFIKFLKEHATRERAHRGGRLVGARQMRQEISVEPETGEGGVAKEYRHEYK